MPKSVVKVEGKLLVRAADKKLALDQTNVFMSDKGLPSFKANEYHTEEIDDSTILEAA